MSGLFQIANDRFAVSPMEELGAYEALWERQGTSFKSLADMFRSSPDARPSDAVPRADALSALRRVVDGFRSADVGRFGVRLKGTADYPSRLADAAHPLQFLYFQGWWDLAETRSVAVVGTRSPTEEGVRRARRLVKELVRHGFTIASGLADGIDTVAHETAIEEKGQTIGVIGTPLSSAYPRKNAVLQRFIAEHHLFNFSSAGAAISSSKSQLQSFLLPGAQHHNVCAFNSHCNRRSG